MSNNKSPQRLPPPKGAGKGGVTCSVVLLDGETLEVPIDKNDIGRVLFDRVCEHLDLLEKDFFGFTYTDDRGPSHLKYWLNLDKKISKVKKRGAWVFDFALKFYPPDPAQLRESLTRWLVVLQIRRDLLSGRIPCTLTTYALLGSYNVQADIGEYDPSDHGHSHDYIRNMTFSPHQTPELLERITELHKQHKGQTPDEAERAFLDNAKKLAMYGIDLHKARDADNNAVMLGVCCSGLLIYREKLRISRFVWPKILKLSYKRNYFNIKIRPGELERGEATIGFKLDNHRLAKRLWKTCVEHHAFFRLRESETPTNNPTFPRFGSKFRYSGRTLYQSRNSEINRPQPFFERQQPNRNSYEDSANRSQSMDELGKKNRTMSVDSRDSSLYGGDTLNRTRDYNLQDPSKNEDMDAFGNTIPRRGPNPYDSLDRRDRVPGRGDATENYDGGKDFMALNGDKPMYRSDIDDPCKYRYNKNGEEYPLAYPCDVAGKEYAFDKDGNKYMLNDGMLPSNGVLLSGAEDPKKYRFDKYGREFPFAFPSDINGKDYAYDKDGKSYPNGKNGLRHRFDSNGNEYPYGYPYDREGREYPFDRDGTVYPHGVESARFGYDLDGKRYHYDKDGNEYLYGFPFDKTGKEYPYDQDGNKFPYGGDGQGYVFDSQGKEYPLAFPYDSRGHEYPYDKDGNKCPTEGFRFDQAGNEYPLAYPYDDEGKPYAFDKAGNRYPQGKDGRDMPGYVYGKDGNDYRFDKEGREFPCGFPCDEYGKEYPYNKSGVKCPCSLSKSSPVAAYRYDEAGYEYPVAYPCDSTGKEYAYDKDGYKYPQGRDGSDRTGYVYGKDGNAYRFDKTGQQFAGDFPCDQQGKEYPYNKEGVRCPSSLASSIPAGVYRFDKEGYEYPLAYPCDIHGKEYAYDKDGNRYPQGKDGRDKTGYIYGRDGDDFRFDQDGREFPSVYPCDQQGKEYPYNKDGLRCPAGMAYKENLKYSPGTIAPLYNVDGQRYRYDPLGTEFPFGYPYDKHGNDYPYDEEGNRCPYDGYRFDSLGNEYPLGYPIDKDGNVYCYDRDRNRFPQTKDGADRTGYVYDRDGKRYRFNKNGDEYPYGYPFDRAGKEYCYDQDGKKFPGAGQDQVQQNGYHGDVPDRYDTLGAGDVTSGLPYGVGLGMGTNDMTGVVGVERDLEHSEWFEPLPQTIKETKDSLKNAMPFFSPAATSTVGRNKGPPPPIPAKPNHSAEDSFNYKTERDGVEEAHVVQKVTITGEGGEDDFDFDAALADAIRSVTEFNPDMSVERIECVQQIEDVKDGN